MGLGTQDSQPALPELLLNQPTWPQGPLEGDREPTHFPLRLRRKTEGGRAFVSAG